MTDSPREDHRQQPKPRKQQLPKPETARRLGASNSVLARAGVSDVMTTAEIRASLDDRPDWLVTEREKHAPGTGIVPGTAIGKRSTTRA